MVAEARTQRLARSTERRDARAARELISCHGVGLAGRENSAVGAEVENFTTSTFKKLDATAKTVTPLALMHQVVRANVESWSRYLRQVAGAPPNRPDHIHVRPSEK